MTDGQWIAIFFCCQLIAVAAFVLFKVVGKRGS